MIEEIPDNKNHIKESLSFFSSSVKDPCGEQSSWSDDGEEAVKSYFPLFWNSASTDSESDRQRNILAIGWDSCEETGGKYQTDSMILIIMWGMTPPCGFGESAS